MGKNTIYYNETKNLSTCVREYYTNDYDNAISTFYLIGVHLVCHIIRLGIEFITCVVPPILVITQDQPKGDHRGTRRRGCRASENRD